MILFHYLESSVELIFIYQRNYGKQWLLCIPLVLSLPPVKFLGPETGSNWCHNIEKNDKIYKKNLSLFQFFGFYKYMNWCWYKISKHSKIQVFSFILVYVCVYIYIYIYIYIYMHACFLKLNIIQKIQNCISLTLPWWWFDIKTEMFNVGRIFNSE